MIRLLAGTVALAGLLGCAAVSGRSSAGEGSYVDIERQVAIEDAPALPLLNVVVSDMRGGVLSGAIVEVVSQDGSHKILKYLTGAQGTVAPPVRPGEWRVTVSNVGFAPVSKLILVRSGESCLVRAYLRLHLAGQTTASLAGIGRIYVGGVAGAGSS
ncbi:MAG TPA: hypothetical protein VN032_09360, partial [Thermoanaerobaculia bacterium]|nr:hypothetical protein [Thermoanaerobaculia bacterium]